MKNLIIILILLFCIGCKPKRREHLNPLDPEYPGTNISQSTNEEN